MQNVLLIIHLLLALGLTGIVLLQRSEGGGLGMGGSSSGGMMSSRKPPNPLARATWFLAIAFLCTSLGLTIVATQNNSGGSVIDSLEGTQGNPNLPAIPSGEALLPPGPEDSGPLVPGAE